MNGNLFLPHQLWPLCHPQKTALPLPGNRSGHQHHLNLLQIAGKAANGCPRLHPTTKLTLSACMTVYTFSGHTKLCYVGDEVSRKDFLVDTGATLSLLPFRSTTSATGLKLQSVKGRAIKSWNNVNTQVGNAHHLS
jgi:hypothetical protein